MKSTLTVDGDANDGGGSGPAAIYVNYIFDVDDATIDADGSILVGNHAAAGVDDNHNGTGYMTVQDGATINDDFLGVGWEADDAGDITGRLTIEGADTTWTDNGDAGGDQAGGAYIGVQAAGNVDLTEGATLTEEGGSHFTGVYAGAILGVDDGVHGGMVVEDGATWTIDNDLVVGFYGQGELTVRPGNYADATGGTVTADNLIISQYADDVGYGQVYVEGDGSTITLDGDVTVGGGGTGELHISDGGVVEADGGLTIGADEGGGLYQPTGNFLDITGDNSALTAQGEAQIGVASDGSITLEEGGELTTADATLGVDADITGMATIGDDASKGTWTINGDLTIGGDGTGTIEFGTDGGTLDVTGDALTIAEGDGSTGTLTLQNADSTLTFDGDMTIGAAGDGTLELEDGATYTGSGDIVIGADDTGSGTLTITGADTSFTAGGDVTVGQDGSGSVSVADGATFDASGADVTIGESGDGQTNTLDVTDDGSTLSADNVTVGKDGTSSNSLTADSSGAITVTDKLVIGDSGDGTVTVKDGGSLTADEIDVGQSLGGTGELDIDGDKSAVVSMHDFNLGSYGTATLDISDSGGLTTDGDATVGAQTEAVVQTVTLDSNATWIVEGSLTLAGLGVATVTVEGGSQLSAYGDLTIADQAGSSAIVMVQQETTTDPITQSGIGYGGTLTVGNYGMATLEISDGGLVNAITGGTGEIDVAAQAAPPNTTIVDSISVDGTDSALDGTNLWLGGSAAGAGGDATLSVTNGGTVTVDTLTIYGGGSATVNAGTINAGDLTIFGGGSLTLNNATVSTDPITVDKGATITGSGEIDGAITNNGTITGDGSGLLNLNAIEISGTGTLALGPFGDMLIDGAVDATQSIQFDPGHQAETLGLVFPWEVHADITNFFTGDTISLGHLGAVKYQYVGDTLQITSANFPDFPVNLVFTGAAYTTDDFTLVTDSDGYVTLTTDIPCFVAGTRIRTPDGDVAVEDLREGDQVVTRNGARPIVWIGRTEIDLAEPDSAHPIRIGAGAFGARVPERDLLVSPEHAIHADGVLIPARFLVNGVTITQDRSFTGITYFHIECPEHEILLAEGLEAESYLDTGNRALLARAA